MLARAIGGARWSNATSTPYFFYRSTGWDKGKIHRVDFDNPKSLAIKSAYAKGVGARGVGMWTADLLDYGDAKLVKAMWDSFKPFSEPGAPHVAAAR